MVGTHTSDWNSQPFTNCCGLAVTAKEWECPGCKQEVAPGKDATEWEREQVRR